MHINHTASAPVEFVLELDEKGNGNWLTYQALTVAPGENVVHTFAADLQAEWIRIIPKGDAASVNAYFHYNEDPAERESLKPGKADVFASIPSASSGAPIVGGIVRPMGTGYPQEETRLQFIARLAQPDGSFREQQYIIDKDMVMRADSDKTARTQFKEDLQGDVSGPDFGIDDASIWLEEQGRRYRLPKGDSAFDQSFVEGWPRGQREIITERAVWNAHGSFYEVPRENSHGLRHMRPICTHNRKIMDYCTWRGLMTLVGVSSEAAPDDHCVRSEDGQAALWFGAVDDLWKLGKSVGVGGPLKDTSVVAGEASDPYLMTGYDRKEMTLSHDSSSAVTFRVEIDPTGYDNWVTYKECAVAVGQELKHKFPVGFSAHWVRIVIDKDCTATAQFRYE